MSEAEIIEAEVEEVETTQALVVQADPAVVTRGEITVGDMVEQNKKIMLAMSEVMHEGVHYGRIPGIDKPTLFKPGAEVLGVLFRLAPHYDSEKIWHPDGHLTVISKCTLRHIPTDLVIATGEGLCTTMEEKYAVRQGQRICPECGKAEVRQSQRDQKEWYCWRKQGGCGQTWPADSEQGRAFAATDTSKVANDRLADSYNTVLKMANKRAQVAATLNGTAASDIYTQDMEDAAGHEEEPATPPPPTRVEGPGPFPVPRSWAMIEEAVKAYDLSTWKAFQVFMKQASVFLFGPEIMTKPQRDLLFQKAAGVTCKLRDAHEVDAFPPPVRIELQAHWALALEGHVLDGPAWRMSPDEEDREPMPTEEQAANEKEVEAAVKEEFPEAQVVPEDEVPAGAITITAEGVDDPAAPAGTAPPSEQVVVDETTRELLS